MLGRLWGTVWDAIGNAVDWLLGAIGNTVLWLLNAAGDAVVWLLNPVIDWLDGPIAWTGAAVVGVVGWLGGSIAWLREQLDPVVDPIGNLLDPAGEILADLWPPVAAGIAAIVALRTVRWLLLLWRGRTPRIQISNFAWATSDKEDREATWVTSLFREQLAALRLDALDPLPERAPGAPLVEIVEGVGQGIGRNLDIGKALGRLFRTVWPDAAYEVWGTLRPREGGRGGHISVQLIERRRGNRTLLNVALDQASWKEGAREAAMAVAGALYPRVRRTDRGPWTLWKGTVPRKLMGHYHDARRYEEVDQLEHALAAYHAALDLDPLNPNLRLKIAMLQERLELNLDAWVTYEAIVDESDRRAWRGPDRRVYMLALYRLAVMLSNGRVPEQWVKNASIAKGKGTLRDDERRKRREELMLSLTRDPLFTKSPRLRLPTSGLGGPTSWLTSSRIIRASAAGLLAMLRAAGHSAEPQEGKTGVFQIPDERLGKSKEHVRKIDAVLQILSLRRLEELDAWLRVRPPLWPRQWREWWVHRPIMRQWPSRPEFARSAIRTSKLLVRIRIAASLERRLRHGLLPPSSPASAEKTKRREKAIKDRGKAIKEIREAHRKLTKRWPFPPAGRWRIAIHWLAPRRRWANRRNDAWQLHYNAACATASVLRKDSVLSSFERARRSMERRQVTPLGKARKWMLRNRKALEKWLPLAEGAVERRLREGAMRKWQGLSRRSKDEVIERAVAQLEEYAYRAGSRRVAAQADWLAIDDPDLKGLRGKPAFKLWASHHLPRTLPPDLPSRKTDVKRFTVRVVHDGARLFADVWRERAAHATPSATEIVDWWNQERRAWEVLGNTCREHLSWEERLRWLKMLQDWLRTGKRTDQIDFGHEARGTVAAETVTEGIFETIADLTGARRAAGATSGVQVADDTVLAWVKSRTEYVCRAHETGETQADATGSLLLGVERREALRAFRIWSRLADAFEAELIAPHRGDDLEDLGPRVERIRHALTENGTRDTSRAEV